MDIKKVISWITNFLIEAAETAVLALTIFFISWLFLVRPHQVEGTSMIPTFHDKDYILTEMVTYKILKQTPTRGDVIVFKFPGENRDFIKRVIAVGGEKIKIQDNTVTIYNDKNPNGMVLEEPYLAPGTETKGKTTIREGEVFEIAAGTFVVMGDNRERSSDSRERGVLPKDNVIGKVLVRYWPPEDFKIF